MDKLEADFRHVEEILDRAKTDVMNLVPEFESFGATVAKENGTDSPGQEQKEKSHAGWFSFLSHKA